MDQSNTAPEPSLTAAKRIFRVHLAHDPRQSGMIPPSPGVVVYADRAEPLEDSPTCVVFILGRDRVAGFNGVAHWTSQPNPGYEPPKIDAPNWRLAIDHARAALAAVSKLSATGNSFGRRGQTIDAIARVAGDTSRDIAAILK